LNMRALPSNSRDLSLRSFQKRGRERTVHRHRTPPSSFETTHGALVASPQCTYPPWMEKQD